MLKTFLATTLILLALTPGHAQQVKFDPHEIDKDRFLNELIALRTKEPGLDLPELVERSNGILSSFGAGFSIGFDEATCTKLNELKARSKDLKSLPSLGASIRSVGAENVQLSLPWPEFREQRCGGCRIVLPLLELTASDFVTRIRNTNIKFHRPTNLHFETVIMVDPANESKEIRRWNIPFRSTPVGVSYDGTVVYISFPQPELKDLSLTIFAEGAFQVGSRKEADEGGLGTVDKPRSEGQIERTIRFKRWGKDYVLRYLEPCG